MGWQDRDYLHARHRCAAPFKPSETTQRWNWTVILCVLLGAFVLFKGYQWVLKRQETQRTPGYVQPAPQPAVPPAEAIPAPADPRPQWVKCLVDGQTMYTDAGCPQGAVAQRRQEDAVAPPPVRSSTQATTLYHCQAYSGETFWSSTHCNQHRALVDRMVNVSSSLPFEQQVQIAESRRRAVSTSATPSTLSSHASAHPAVADKRDACRRLNHLVAHWDAMARQPHSAQTQDWIREERKKVRDRQFALRC